MGFAINGVEEIDEIHFIFLIFRQVNWQVQNRALGSDNNVTADVDPASGTATIEADKRSSEIRLSIVFDGLPELNEDFTMHLVSAEGGAEIDSTFNTSSFTVQYV